MLLNVCTIIISLSTSENQWYETKGFYGILAASKILARLLFQQIICKIVILLLYSPLLWLHKRKLRNVRQCKWKWHQSRSKLGLSALEILANKSSNPNDGSLTVPWRRWEVWLSAAFIGKWPLLSSKIASLAGSHLVGAVAVSPGSVMVYTSINYNSSYQNKVLCAFSLQTSTMSTWHWGCTTVCLHSAQSSLVLSAVLIGTRWWTYRGPEYHN